MLKEVFYGKICSRADRGTFGDSAGTTASLSDPSVWKLAIHAGCGFLCLWLLNTVSPYSGIVFPVNAVTVLIAGVLGLPGIGLMALLALM